MAIPYDAYEVVVGLEVHAQLLTQSKLFCGDSASFGAAPNTNISPVTLGHPGTLPVLNQQAVKYAIMMGLACGSTITRHNYFARKHYFYPDLPKGYQISQHTTAICDGGFVQLVMPDGDKIIRLNRIHLEEDAGKSLHDEDPQYTCVDYNRAGVPLIEIVSEPDLSSGDEAYAYLTILRQTLRYLGICDGNMEEGSMRCDANISVRKKGDPELGTKVEVKNLNSIRNVKRAIEIEAKRLIELLHTGQPILQQTRSFDAGNQSTFALRTKEEANDYRYFPDPDLAPFGVTPEMLAEIEAQMPELPAKRRNRFQETYQLSPQDAAALCEEKEFADWFESILVFTPEYKAAANWMLGPIRSSMNESQTEVSSIPIKPAKIARFIELINEGKLNFSTAASRIFPVIWKEPEHEPLTLALQLNLIQDSNEDNLVQWVNQVLEGMPDKVDAYKKGKKGLIGLFMGEVKKVSGGKADPKRTNAILLEKLQ